MSPLPDWAARFQVDIPTTESTVGIYVSRDGDDAVINFRDSSAVVRMATTYRPIPGEPVTLTWLDGLLRVTGPVRARSAIGTVTTVGNPYLTVDCDGRAYQLGYSLQLVGQVAVGDQVAIVWAGGGYVSDKITAVATGDDVQRLTTDQEPFTLIFLALESGSNSPDDAETQAWIAGDVRSVDGGGWFYGPALRDSLADDASVFTVEAYLPARSGGGAQIGRHTLDSAPTDQLSLDDETVLPVADGWVTLPLEWVEDWRDSPGGIGASGGTDTVFKGIQADRQSGKLRITGRQ